MAPEPLSDASYAVTSTSVSWASVRERGGGLLFALALNGLMLLALLTLAPKAEQRVEDPRHPVSFTLAPTQKAEKAKAEPRKSEERERRERPKQQAVKEPKRPVLQKPVVPPRLLPAPRPLPEAPAPFLVLDSAQLASADIGRMPAKDAGPGASGQGQSAAAAAGPGEGPGGVQLFEAEWYRRPTPVELATYIPANAPPSGWGLVACKTVDDFRVENCQALGESPAGSGFARAVRLASWQFLVRPPRVNGKAMVGSWVRIRIDYTRSSNGAG